MACENARNLAKLQFERVADIEAKAFRLVTLTSVSVAAFASIMVVLDKPTANGWHVGSALFIGLGLLAGFLAAFFALRGASLSNYTILAPALQTGATYVGKFNKSPLDEPLDFIVSLASSSFLEAEETGRIAKEKAGQVRSAFVVYYSSLVLVVLGLTLRWIAAIAYGAGQ